MDATPDVIGSDDEPSRRWPGLRAPDRGPSVVLAAAAVGLGSAAGVVLALLSNGQAALAVLLAVTGLVLLAVNLHELIGHTGQRKRATPAGADPS